jgi:hypothetical protein
MPNEAPRIVVEKISNILNKAIYTEEDEQCLSTQSDRQ